MVIIIAPFSPKNVKLYKGFDLLPVLESGKGGEGTTEINGLLLTKAEVA